ncbi:Type I restriction-modification system, specificity subunit S (EC [uncultured Gammaproteobacteria bacterium]|nr:Type I restriction-modification system, specificity subunit S (EC [uncultured Gammaproteobacteria bacterium]
MFGLDADTLRNIKKVFATLPNLEKVILYGSRAKGNYKDGSDIDITLLGKQLTLKTVYALEEVLGELYLPYTFDISIFTQIDNDDLIKHILRVGKTFYLKENGKLKTESGAKNNSQLPKGWEVKKLGEVCEVQRGLTYSGKDAVDYSDIIVLRATNINLERSALDFSELKYLRNNFIIKDKYKLRKGSLLICFSSGSKNHLGKVALVDNNYNYAFGGFIGQINPKREVDSKYLFYSLISEQYKQYISELTDGVNINNLKIKDLQNFQIPTPSLPEQKRIITILDRTFKAIDQAKTNTEQNLKNAKELFESYLNRIFEEKGDDWEEKRLGEVCNIIGGGTPSKKNDEFYIGNIPWATVRDMKTDKIKDTEFKITSKAVLNSSTNIIPKGNVIIATRVGLGKICIIESNIAINQDLKGIIPKASKQLSVGFLFRWFKNISNDIINEGTGQRFRELN